MDPLTTKQIIGIVLLSSICNYGIWISISEDLKEGIILGSLMMVVFFAFGLIIGLI